MSPTSPTSVVPADASAGDPPDRRERDVMVDVGMALDILDACLPSQDGGGAPRMRADEPGELLRLALSHIDLTPIDLVSSPLIPDKMASAEPVSSRVFTLGALIALREADRAQRLGACWHCSVQAARRAVIKYLGLIPDRLLEEHLDHRGRAAITHPRCSARTVSGARSR
jgi:hypothetical protein